MKTKGQRKAEDRRALRAKMKRRDCGARGKMVGRLCRYSWGDGRPEGTR